MQEKCYLCDDHIINRILTDDKGYGPLCEACYDGVRGPGAEEGDPDARVIQCFSCEGQIDSPEPLRDTEGVGPFCQVCWDQLCFEHQQL